MCKVEGKSKVRDKGEEGKIGGETSKVFAKS